MNAPQSPQVDLDSADIRWILVGMVAAMLLAALDQTIVATAIPTIGRDLGDAENLPWIVTAYLLASTAVTPLYGKLSDSHGRRIMLLIAIVTFLLGSVFCALAPTMIGLALARGLQGIGGGGLIALSMTVLADIYPPEDRPRYQVAIATVFTTSSLAGPLLGGFFAQHLHWSLIFWINLPIAIPAFLLVNSKLKLLPRHGARHQLDYLGSALLVIGSSSLMLALSWGGMKYAWVSPTIIGLLVLAALATAGFSGRVLTAPEPLIPRDILKDQVVRAATMMACFAMGTLTGLTIYVPIFLEGVIGLDPSRSGIAMVPLMIGAVIGAAISSRSMLRFERYKQAPIALLAMSAASCMIMSGYGERLPIALMEVLFVLLSMGIGAALPLSTISIQNAVGAHQLGIATATMGFFRALGGAFAVAIFGTIVLGGAAGAVGGISHDAGGFIAGTDKAHLVGAFRWVFAAASLGALASLACMVLMEERPLNADARPGA